MTKKQIRKTVGNIVTPSAGAGFANFVIANLDTFQTKKQAKRKAKKQMKRKVKKIGNKIAAYQAEIKDWKREAKEGGGVAVLAKSYIRTYKKRIKRQQKKLLHAMVA